MYIQPSTEIHILQNIPLNKSYEHTVFYKDAQTQATEFLKYEKYMLTNYSYQRANLGTLRVELKYENLYNCNYMMFKNNAFEDKWFYAFITGVSYVSNEVSEIYYEIDVMQTWCYDYSFLKTFIERQHSKEDIMFQNTVPEGLELGSEYRLIKGISYFTSGSLAWVVLATTNVTGSGVTAYSGMIGGVYTGLVMYYLRKESDLVTLLNAFKNAGQEDAIVAFYQAPYFDISKPLNQPYRVDLDFEMQENLGNAYKPRNNKLYCYPYTYLECYSTLGISGEFKFDEFENRGAKKVKFAIDSTIFPQAQMTATPYWYRGVNLDYASSVGYNLFPTCSFSGDAFKAWWAQNKNSYMASMNAIGNNYDTNQRIISNNYAMASLSASTALTNSGISANTALANANASNQTALAINENNRQFGQIQNTVNGMSGIIGNALSANVGGVINSAVNMGTSMYGTELSANNTASTLATDLANTNRSVGASQTIARNSYSTAMKNASMAEVNSNLSNLNTYQNATAMLVAKKQDIQHIPNTAHGNAMCDGLNYSRNTAGFMFRQWGLSEEYAKKIDKYFDKYGYAQNTAYVPERLNRKHYSYLKTVGCNIVGKMNNNDILTIKGIYDNGITTWDTLQNVGHYDIDNSVERN